MKAPDANAVDCTLEQIDEAAVWMAMLHSQDRDRRTEQGFRRWLEAHPAHALAFEQGAVFLKGAWILAEIFVRAELRGVDEDGDGDQIAFGTRGAHQRKMAFVQRAHRRHEAKDATFSAQLSEGRLCLSYCFEDEHGGYALRRRDVEDSNAVRVSFDR